MEIKNLTFKYPNSNRNIFNSLDLRIERETINILIGENGTGKTTLFDIISGLIDCEYKTIDKIMPENILYQMQGVPMIRTITGKELAELVLGSDGKCSIDNLKNQPLMQKLNNQMIKKFDYLWNTEYGFMSVGERRWFTILLFCHLERELYIFDEPTAGLDMTAAKSILSMLSILVKNRKKTVLFTTHRMEEIDYFQNYHITILKNGNDYFSGCKDKFEKSNKFKQTKEVLENYEFHNK